MPALRRILPLVYLLVLAWINLYICREMFFIEHTGYMNSMHGFWMAMARLAPATHWVEPAWWPFWYGGMPFEYTYAPLVPGVTAAVAKVASCSPARAYHGVSGFIYCLAPLALFVAAWRITRASGYSFIAAAAYSLVSPTELLVPDDRFNLAHFRDARRLYLAVVWDETPHIASLSFATLAMLFVFLSLRDRRPIFYALAAIFMAAAVLANPFGGVLIVMILFSLIFARETPRRKSDLLLGLLIAAVSYLVTSPWFPPSLLATIRRNAERFDNPSTVASFLLFLGVILGWLLLWQALRRWVRDWTVRFFALLACLAGIIPVLYAYAGRNFVTQPGRYKMEMEVALILLGTFAARRAVEKFDVRVKAALAALLLWFAAQQVISHRRYAKQIIRRVNIEDTVEYRLARWVDRHLPGQRVMMAGSIAQWFNAFSDTPQFAGGSFPTAPNWIQQIALNEIYLGGRGEASIAWLKAFGVQVVAAPGRESEEFWKPYPNPQKFEGLLPIEWREGGVTMYRIPQRSASLAHVIPASAIVRRAPRDGQDLPEVEQYVAALDDPALPVAELRWSSRGRGQIRASMRQGQVLSVQVNYHRGWHAGVNGKPAQVIRDGLGLLAITPDCEGPCEIEIRYDGGWEARLCRWLSAIALAGVCLVACGVWKTSPTAQPHPYT